MTQPNVKMYENTKNSSIILVHRLKFQIQMWKVNKLMINSTLLHIRYLDGTSYCNMHSRLNGYHIKGRDNFIQFKNKCSRVYYSVTNDKGQYIIQFHSLIILINKLFISFHILIDFIGKYCKAFQERLIEQLHEKQK